MMKFKKYIVMIVLISSFALNVNGVSASLSYKDIKDSWYINEIVELTEKEIISGNIDGTFRPKDSVTRAQASKIIWGAIENIQLDKHMKNKSDNFSYEDVQRNAWYEDYIYKMQANGIISGYPDKTFKPGNNLTRAQAVKIIVETFNIDEKRNVSNMFFQDVDENDWYYNYVEKAHNAGIVTKGFDFRFNPNHNISREELVSFTSKAMKWHNEKHLSLEEITFDRLDRSITPENHKYPNSYKSMQKGLSNFEEIIYFDLNELKYLDVKNELMYKDFYWGTPSKYYIESWITYGNGEVKVNYSNPPEVAKKKQDKVDKKVEDVLEQIIKPTHTDFDKVKAIQDYIVLNTAYDLEGYENGTSDSDAYTIYGTLINGVAVCDGYARTVSYLLDQIGIENYYVTGQAKSGGLHAWNLVNIDGEYYYMDATWDDPTPNEEGVVAYNYFLLDEKEFEKTRTWDKSGLPKAKSKRYSNK